MPRRHPFTQRPSNKRPTRTQHQDLAIGLVHQFFRNNTSLEDLHAGIFPGSQAGDYSDVKAVTPYGEIPWANLSRISDEEMKRLMIECVDNVYTFLCHQDVAVSLSHPKWNRPRINRKLLRAWQKIRKMISYDIGRDEG